MARGVRPLETAQLAWLRAAGGVRCRDESVFRDRLARRNGPEEGSNLAKAVRCRLRWNTPSNNRQQDAALETPESQPHMGTRSNEALCLWPVRSDRQ